RYVKHATLIERCFPLEKDNNASPNSNELSYLVYYAQSKPAKLTKVGTYLSKRALRDVQKHRYSDIRVTLCIFDALLEACGDDLHFFAKDVLETLNTGLSLNESVLSKASMQTFVLFCRKHTGSALAIDKDLCALYCGIIRTFASFAMKCDSKKDTDLSLAALGLRAIQAVAESRATYAADCFYELPCVVKAIVTSIAQTYTPGESVSVAIAEDRLGTIDEMSDLSAVPNNAVLCSGWTKVSNGSQLHYAYRL
ncbi:plasma membrane localization protein, partial [Coemansia sp. RSA 1804]